MNLEGLTFSIPDIPPSLNKFAGRLNVWVYRAAKATWKQIVIAHCLPPATPYKKARVLIHFTFPTAHRRDGDNYIKMLLDGLVAAKVIEDDDIFHITLTISGEVQKGVTNTLIRIWEDNK